MGYLKLVCYFAETVKGRTKYRLRTKNCRGYAIVSALRAQSCVPQASWSTISLHPSDNCSLTGKTMLLLTGSRRQQSNLAACTPVRLSLARSLLLGGCLRLPSPAAHGRALSKGLTCRQRFPPCTPVPLLPLPRHAKGAIIIIKNKSFSLPIVLTGHCCHLARSITNIHRSLQPVCFPSAAGLAAGINASLVTH